MSARTWNVSLRMILVSVIAVAAVWTTAPRARAMDEPQFTLAVVAAEAFASDIRQVFVQFKSDHEALLMEIVNEIQAAGDEGDLKQVLKLEKRYSKLISKTLKPVRKLTTSRGKSTIKMIEKRKTDPSKDFAVGLVQQEVADRLAEVDMVESDLRFHVSSSVQAAINSIMR